MLYVGVKNCFLRQHDTFSVRSWTFDWGIPKIDKYILLLESQGELEAVRRGCILYRSAGESMLIAEIHGKRIPEVEGQEDWLTSAVFGHLRQISPGGFWFDLFSKAVTVGEPKASLSSILASSGVTLAAYDRLNVVLLEVLQRLRRARSSSTVHGRRQSPADCADRGQTQLCQEQSGRR